MCPESADVDQAVRKTLYIWNNTLLSGNRLKQIDENRLYKRVSNEHTASEHLNILS